MPPTFDPYSTWHLIPVLLVAAGTVLACRAGGGARRPLAVAAIGLCILTTIWAAWSTSFDWRSALPIQICDLGPPLAAIALLTRRRWAQTLMYFWGLGLSSQALITPDLLDGPARLGFWLFFAAHGLIVGIAIYLLVVDRYRPGWRDCGVAIAVTLLYAALMLPINLLLDANYGYVGKSVPGQPSLIDVLGPWPLRVGWMVLAMIAVFALMTAVWRPGARAAAGARF